MVFIDRSIFISIEEKDSYTANHCLRVATLAEALGLKLGLQKEDLHQLYEAGIMHDVGKISIPDSVLFKHAHLDNDEWEIMKTHSVLGERILMAQDISSMDSTAIIKAVLHHHEHWDGSGYPDGLAGNEIPLFSRILLVADCYDAMTTTRVYRNSLSHDQAIEIMKKEACIRSDPEIFQAFYEIIKTGSLKAASAIEQENFRRD